MPFAHRTCHNYWTTSVGGFSCCHTPKTSNARFCMSNDTKPFRLGRRVVQLDIVGWQWVRWTNIRCAFYCETKITSKTPKFLRSTHFWFRLSLLLRVCGKYHLQPPIHCQIAAHKMSLDAAFSRFTSRLRSNFLLSAPTLIITHFSFDSISLTRRFDSSTVLREHRIAIKNDFRVQDVLYVDMTASTVYTTEYPHEDIASKYR